MSRSYDNVTLKGPDQSEIAAYLEKHPHLAFISPTVDGVTTVTSEIFNESLEQMCGFARDISRHFQCPALALINHDDVFIAYVLYNADRKDHVYHSDPWYFEGEQLGGDFGLTPEQMPPEPENWETAPAYTAGGDAAALVRLFGNNADIAELDRILHAPNLFEEDDDDEDYDDENDFTFSVTRHEALLNELGLPLWGLRFDVSYFTGSNARHYYKPEILKIGGDNTSGATS